MRPADNVLVTSSALDRTLQSARSFLAGVFQDLNTPTPTQYLPDGAAPVPVYAAAGADADDTLIRAYANCPAFAYNVTAFYASPAFQAMSAATAPFRAYVASLSGYGVGVLPALASTDPQGNAFSLQNWRARRPDAAPPRSNRVVPTTNRTGHGQRPGTTCGTSLTCT